MSTKKKIKDDLLHENGRFLAGCLNDILCDELDSARSTALRWIGISAYLEKCDDVPADVKKSAKVASEYMQLAYDSVDRFSLALSDYLESHE